MRAKRWREHGDRGAAHKLVTSHLRLVTKIARDYRGYGLPISEAISEGNVGLMQAVESLTTAIGKTILAEFIYGGKVTPTLPLNPAKEHWVGWWIKVTGL